MLLEFRVDNFRSIRDEQVLTFEASLRGADTRLRRIDGCAHPVLPVASLYGANASGKSNVLLAFQFMSQAIRDSHRRWEPHEGVPGYDPFAAEGASSQPSLFEVTFVVAAVRYRYGFVVDSERIVEEWLYAWPLGRKQVWFERDGLELSFGARLRGPNRRIAQQTRPNALFLSTAVQHAHKQLSAVYEWFLGVQFHAPRDHAPGQPLWPAVLRRMILSEEPIPGVDAPPRDALLNMARSADLGIIDIREDHDLSERFGWAVGHRMADGVSWLPLEVESRGTQVFLFRLGPLVLWSLHHGGVLVVDELESSLHPLLAAEIVRLFNAPETNPRSAQLLFTTHNTELLGNQLGDTPLRRDQIWITEKDHDGATALFPLTDFRARKHENLERGYLQGRYGGVPLLGNLVPAETRP